MKRTPLSDTRFNELAKQIQDPNRSLAQRAALRLKLFLEEECAVKNDAERIYGWRSIPTFPDIYLEGEKETLQKGHYIHEQ